MHRLLNRLTRPLPRPELQQLVWTRLALAARRRLYLFLSISLASLGGLLAVWSQFWTSFVASGLITYLQLLISDYQSLALYWRELLLALAESLPLVALTAGLALVSLMIWSSAKALREARFAFNFKHA